MTQQEQFEADYRTAFPVATVSQPHLFDRDADGDYGNVKACAAFGVWLQQAKRHEAEMAFIKLAKQQIEDRLISCEQSLANAFDECEQLRAKSEAEIAELVAALKGMLDVVSGSRGVAKFHLNGDTAEWDEFYEVDVAEAAISKYGDKP